MTTTGAALLRAIYADPDDDTPRLVYADWLDEQPTASVPCLKCKGTLWVPERDPASGRDEGGRTNCQACRGTGTVPDTANRDQAEFIRVQVELARLPECRACRNTGIYSKTIMGYRANAGGVVGVGQRPAPCPDCRRVRLLARESALLVANRERWLRVQCPVCVGLRPYGDNQCQACANTGDIGGLTEFSRPGDSRAKDPCRFPAVFRRGFPDEVRGCRLADCFERDVVDSGGVTPWGDSVDVPGEWVPTPWIRRVLTHHPTVTRVPLAGVMPYKWKGAEVNWLPGFVWHCDDVEPGGVLRIPRFLWERVQDEYPTAEAATDALAVAVRRAASALPSANG